MIATQAPDKMCPTCGGPVRVVGGDEGTMSYDPALTGAQVDAAYRMVAAIRMWRGRMSPAGVTLHADQSDLLAAARDFEEIQRRRGL